MEGSNPSEKQLIQCLSSDNLPELKQYMEKGIGSGFKFTKDCQDLPRFLSFSPNLTAAAAFFGANECLKHLLSLHPDLSHSDRWRTPISYFAAAGGSVETITLLINYNFSFSGASFSAIETSSIPAIQFLHDHRLVSPLDTDCRGYSPINAAIAIGNQTVIDFLIQKGYANLSSRSFSPISFAILHEKTEIAKQILNSIKILPFYSDGQTTPLHIASSKGYTEIVKLLLSKQGAQVTVMDENKKTPLQLASNDEIRDILFQKEVEHSASKRRRASDDSGCSIE